MQTSAPTPTDQNDEPPAERPPEPTNTPPTVPDPMATEDRSLGDTNPPASIAQPPSPTPSDHTPDPENILDILEEE